jgi:hypothetical protein
MSEPLSKFKQDVLRDLVRGRTPHARDSYTKVVLSTLTGASGGVLYGAFKTYRDLVLDPAASPADAADKKRPAANGKKVGQYAREPIKFGSSGTAGSMSGAERNRVLRANLPLFRANMLLSVKQFSVFLGMMTGVEHLVAHTLTKEHRPLNGFLAGMFTGGVFGLTLSSVHMVLGAMGLGFVYGGMSQLEYKIANSTIEQYQAEIEELGLARDLPSRETKIP